jgi:L-asparagine transporter-like permease
MMISHFLYGIRKAWLYNRFNCFKFCVEMGICVELWQTNTPKWVWVCLLETIIAVFNTNQ